MVAMARREILLKGTGVPGKFLVVKEAEEWGVDLRTKIGVTLMVHFMVAVVEGGLVPTILVRLVRDREGLVIKAWYIFDGRRKMRNEW